MSVSIDYSGINQKLESLTHFVAFVKAISKPEELVATIESMQKEADRLKELLGASDTVEKAEVFMEECRKEMQKGFDDLESKETAFEVKVAQWNEDVAKREEALNSNRDSQVAMSLELKNTSERVQKELQDLKYQRNKLELWAQSLEETENRLREREDNLTQKAEKLKALLG